MLYTFKSYLMYSKNVIYYYKIINKGYDILKIDNEELEEIFININKNKTQGIEQLYNKYKKVVYSIAFSISKNKEDSEDITQMIFAKIYEMEDSKLPTNNYASWIYSTTKNETINFLKKEKKDISIDKIYEISDNNNELNKVIDNIEFNSLISKLNSKEKEIVSLKILSNFSFKEISKMLNEPVGTVKWRYYKSIYSLKVIFGNLAMFIISFTIGIKTLYSNQKSEKITKQENIEQSTHVQEEGEDTTKSDEEYLQDESKSYNSEKRKEENVMQDITSNNSPGNTTTNITQNTSTNTTTIIENTNTIQESTIYEEVNNNYNQYIGYGFLGISSIFLVIFLYFFIKYKLKSPRKLSK